MAEAPTPTQAPTPANAHAGGRAPRGGQGGRPPRRNDRGPAVEEKKEFDERIVHIDRVARVVKGGRRFRFRALVVIGDHKGRVGIGIAKGADVTAAVTKATEVAKKHLHRVNLYKGTLPHEAEGKISGARILIKPASAGTGLIAGGVVRTILEVTGVSNVLSKSLGSTNKANTAYATIAALQSLEPAKNWVTNRTDTAAAKAQKTEKPAAKKAPAKEAASKEEK